MRGSTDPAFGTLARIAILVSVAAPFVAVAAYTLSYRRHFTKISESIVNFSAVRSKVRYTGRHPIANLFLRTPFERGCFFFAWKALFRSENHMLILGGFSGVGIVLAAEALYQSASVGGANGWPSEASLSVPLIVFYLLLVGLRLSFEIPVTQKANWIFRLRANDARKCLGLARKIMLTFLIPPLLAIALPAYSFIWGWRVGIIHAAVVAASSMLLIEILLVHFRKIPFTCSAPHFKSSIPVSAFFYFAGCILFTHWVPVIERRASNAPLWYLGFILEVMGIWLVLAGYRRHLTRFDSQLIFEERSDVGDVAMEVLNLSWVARDTERTVRSGQ